MENQFTAPEWVDITGFEGLYKISRSGLVASYHRSRLGSGAIGWKILATTIDPKGYYRVALCKNKTRTTGKVYRLVAAAFIPNPLGLPQVNHIDGNKHNNAVGNLEWCTNQQNQQHAFAMGLNSNKGVRNGRSKITEDQVKSIRDLAQQGMHYREIATRFPINAATTHKIISGKLWSTHA